MKLLNGEIFSAKEPLEKLLDIGEMPIEVSYKLAKMANKLNEQFNIIEQVRLGLIRKHGEVNKEDPDQIVVNRKSEKYPKFVGELTELMNQEEEVVIEVVKIPKEVDGKPLKIKGSILVALEKFVDVG